MDYTGETGVQSLTHILYTLPQCTARDLVNVWNKEYRKSANKLITEDTHFCLKYIFYILQKAYTLAFIVLILKLSGLQAVYQLHYK